MSTTPPAIDSRLFRKALGTFATGVTVITTRTSAGIDAGLTANSFNSVSLDPPLVLWSLAKSSASLQAFQDSDHFAVHVLAADQQPLSDLFAMRGADKFEGMTLGRGAAGLPLLSGSLAVFQCRTAHRYEGGDHIIFVGEVLEYTQAEGEPLLYWAGRYAALAPTAV